MLHCILAYSGTSRAYFKINKYSNTKINKNSGEQKKRIHYSCEGRIEKNPSLGITVCHHSASLVMPNGDPRDGFFYPTLTLMIDSYNLRFYPGTEKSDLTHAISPVPMTSRYVIKAYSGTSGSLSKNK